MFYQCCSCISLFQAFFSSSLCDGAKEALACFLCFCLYFSLLFLLSTWANFFMQGGHFPFQLLSPKEFLCCVPILFHKVLIAFYVFGKQQSYREFLRCKFGLPFMLLPSSPLLYLFRSWFAYFSSAQVIISFLFLQVCRQCRNSFRLQHKRYWMPFYACVEFFLFYFRSFMCSEWNL